MADETPQPFAIPYRILKSVAMLTGALLSIVSLMALLGHVWPNVWFEVGVTVVVLLAIPLFIADRLLPKDDPTKGRGLPSDVLAVTWLVFGVLFSGVFLGQTRGMLVARADRASGVVARVMYFVAGVSPDYTAEQEHARRNPATTARAAAATSSAADGGVATPATDDDAGTPAADRSVTELFRELAPAVVSISVQSPRGGGSGTGFILDRQGTIATNHHVIEDAVMVRVQFMDGTSTEDVELLADNVQEDLALLRVRTSTRLTPARLGDSERVTVGEHVIVIGNPLGLDHTLTDGIVSARRMHEGRRMIQTSAPVSPGNSGGPLFNMRGEVIGVTTLGSIGMGQNLNLAVVVNSLRAMLRSDFPDRRPIQRGGGGQSRGRW